MIQIADLPPTLGMVAFRPLLTHENILKIASQKPLSVLINHEHWDLTARRFEELLQSGSLQYIEALQVRSLKIRWGTSQKIIRSIQQIKFPCLKQLHLNGNLIQNIEGLSLLNLSSLEILNFKQNNITTLKALRKCHLPCLRQLNLYKNRIIDFRPLQELYVPMLTLLWVAPQRDCFVAQQPTSWIFKLQPQKMTKIFIKHPSGRNMDFEEVKIMATARYQHIALVYQIKDDFAA